MSREIIPTYQVAGGHDLRGIEGRTDKGYGVPGTWEERQSEKKSANEHFNTLREDFRSKSTQAKGN